MVGAPSSELERRLPVPISQTYASLGFLRRRVERAGAYSWVIVGPLVIGLKSCISIAVF